MDLREQLQATLGDAYTLERELGGGGMSRVFVAHDTRLKRTIVVKVLSPELAQGISVSRFEREILTAAALQQANIVPVLSAGDTNGLPYFTMPFVEGESLRNRLARGPLAITEVIGVVRDVGKALSYAHGRNFVHRDIKPDNVLLSGGTAVVTDFGIAKAISASRTSDGATLTQMGTSIGTPAYMAPEQAAADPDIDHRADIYALGCLAYELLAGQSPFAGRTSQRMLAAHLTERPRSVAELRPDAPAPLVELVMSCLSKDPSDRPQNAADVVGALESITSGRQQPLWQALAIWLVSVGAAFILARAAIVGIGLPDWVLPGALIVAGLGLPAVLASHYVQRAAPFVTWRAGAMAAGAFVLFVGAFMSMRALGIGPAGSLIGKGVLKQNDRIVLAQVVTRGIDSSLAPVLTEALRADLAQSKAISVLLPSAIRDALRRMQRPAETVLDAAVGREIAQREGAKLVVVSEVARLGAGFVLSAQLLDAERGDPVVSVRETANGDSNLMAAVGRLSRDLRDKIGESLRDLQNSPRLERVSTSSLEAFRKYQAMSDLEGQNPVLGGYALLLEAVKLDTTFAMAYRKLGVLASEPSLQQEYLAKAFRYRDRLPDVERYQAEGMYYWAVSADYARAIDAHLRAARADSTVLRPAVNLRDEYMATREYDEALRWGERADRIDSTGIWALNPLLALHRLAAAESLLARVGRTQGELSFRRGEAYFRVRMAQGQFDLLASTIARWRPLAARDPASRLQLDLVDQLMLGVLRGKVRTAQQRFVPLQEAVARIGGSSVPPFDAALVVASMGVWFRDDTADIERVERMVAATKFEQMTVENRPYLALAAVYAQAHRATRAKAFLARYDAEVRDSLQRRREVNARRDVVGWIALADNRPLDAVMEFTREAEGVNVCYACTQASIGIAYDQADMADSSISHFERFFVAGDRSGSDFSYLADVRFRALALRRLGELYEQKGNIGKAVANYTSFVELWKDADADLQPKVRAVRAKLKRLLDVERIPKL